ARIRARIAGSPTAAICAASQPAFSAWATPTLPVGMPSGIWMVERSESYPWSWVVSMGMPMTGRIDSAEVTPARWAAPPAAAMTTRNPAPSSSLARPPARFGVRWADSTRASNGTWRDSRTANAFSMRGRSESLPTRISTRLLIVVSPLEAGADGSGFARPSSRKRGFQRLFDRRDADGPMVEHGGDLAAGKDDRLGGFVLHAQPLGDGVRHVPVGQQIQIVEV